MIALRQMSGIDDDVKDTVNNHDKGDANDTASSFRTRGGSLSGPADVFNLHSCFHTSSRVKATLPTKILKLL